MKRVLPLFVLIVCLASCHADRRSDNVSDGVQSTDAVLEDFDYFFRSFEQTHPDPYSAFGGERCFHRDVKRLRRTLRHAEGLDADRLQLEIGRFLVPLHDGHTYCGRLNYSYDSEVRYLPLNLRTMTDGFFVWSALEEFKSLLGAEVRSVGGRSLDELMDSLALYVSAENKYGLFSAVSGWKMNSSVLSLILDDFDGEKLGDGLQDTFGSRYNSGSAIVFGLCHQFRYLQFDADRPALPIREFRVQMGRQGTRNHDFQMQPHSLA